MSLTRCRRLAGSFTINGVGLHSGRDCSVRVEPCDELVLSAEGMSLPISKLALTGSGRGSDYTFPNGVRIRTCEHVLSALTGMGVWGARLTVEGGEMPAVDGCAESVARHVLHLSDECHEAPAALNLAEPISVGCGDRFVAAFPSPVFRVTCAVKYSAKVIGAQIFDFDGEADDFLAEISRARTFAMASDIEYLRSHGMALGGSLDNAILVHDDRVEASGGLRWNDEFARHKALDLIGDLAALGRPLCAHVTAVRAGHELHLRLVERLRRLS